jgi:sialate O-acetylesterase
LLIGFPIMPARSQALAEEKLQKGLDRIDVPAFGSGLCLHNLFQSNMVLQRDKPIRIWGWAAPRETVTVSFAGRQQIETAGADRAWSVTFPAMPANSTPAQMLIAGNNANITLDNILLGDVWLLGGQSNMEHPLDRVEDGDLEIASAKYQNIRVLTVPAQNGSEEKEGFPRLYEWNGFFNTHYRKGDWDACSPEIVRELSAIGYVFARRLHMTSQVPIGVIDVSRGGTTVEAWTPDEVLRKIGTPEVDTWLAQWDRRVTEFDPLKDLDERIERHHQWVDRMKQEGREIPADRTVPSDKRPGPAMDQNRPGNCYASMIAPIAGIEVKGAIWHQGFNNALQPEGHVMYHQVFPKMIAAWREAFNDTNLPFGIISLCTEGKPQNLENYLEMMINEGIYIREVQYKTFIDLSSAGDQNIGFASSYDMRRSWYHPGLKVPVGERIARWALATQYGEKIDWKPPMVTEMKAEGGTIRLTMDMPVTGLRDWPMEGFAIAGKDRRFQPAKAEHLVTGNDDRNRPVYDQKVIVLTSPHVSEPIHFRYAWGRNPMGNLMPRSTKSRAPLATQRSDDWRIHEVPVKFGDKADRQSTNLARQTHRLFDTQRRLLDAQRLLDEHQEKNTDELKTWNGKWQK